MNIALVLSVMLFSNLSKSNERLYLFISTKTGSKLANKDKKIIDFNIKVNLIKEEDFPV